MDSNIPAQLYEPIDSINMQMSGFRAQEDLVSSGGRIHLHLVRCESSSLGRDPPNSLKQCLLFDLDVFEPFT